MNKCDCYHTQKKTQYTYDQRSGRPIAHDTDVGVCWGTRECDECRCKGDETKCDFYPKVREKAKKELNETITCADYIRSRNNEELAELLLYKVKCTACNAENCDEKFCLNLIKEWLESLYEEI